jgi:hypothetical protein
MGLLYLFMSMFLKRPLLVAVRTKAWICDGCFVGIVVSNPAGGICLSLVSVLCCHLEVPAMDDHSSRGVLPRVCMCVCVCVCVCMRVIVKPR